MNPEFCCALSGAPSIGPIYTYFSVPLYDPLLGSRIPKEESFPNGGDKKDPLGIGNGGQLSGLNTTSSNVAATLTPKKSAKCRDPSSL